MIKKLFDWPPIWMALCLALIFVIAKLLPFYNVSGFFPSWIWMVFIAVGMIYIIWAEIEFLRTKTTVIPRRIPSSLITTGPFKISRNPIYTGYALIVLGVALKVGFLSGFFVLPLFVLIIHKRFIVDEEKNILENFPQQASIWFKNTKRW